MQTAWSVSSAKGLTMSMESDDSVTGIVVEVCYALPDRQSLVELVVPPGTTAAEAIERSGIREHLPGMEVSNVGIFSRKVSLEHVLQAGDRVEIYRPLIASPREMRQKRARGE